MALADRRWSPFADGLAGTTPGLTCGQLRICSGPGSILIGAGDDERALQMSGVFPSLFRVSTQTMNCGTAGRIARMPICPQRHEMSRAGTPVDINRIAAHGSNVVAGGESGRDSEYPQDTDATPRGHGILPVPGCGDRYSGPGRPRRRHKDPLCLHLGEENKGTDGRKPTLSRASRRPSEKGRQRLDAYNAGALYTMSASVQLRR